MKKLVFLFSLAIICTVSALAFSADPPAVVAAVPSAAPANTFNDVIAWITLHQVIIGALLIGVLDFIFAINPAWKSNGAAHFFYVFAQKLSGKSADAPTPPVA